ncbi:MAG: transketolase C-terminal domain-containing protein, partial [Eubacterium sp.]|nr:transketolase C-terminal domain-containing protein [Eubacterium sp.]
SQDRRMGTPFEPDVEKKERPEFAIGKAEVLTEGREVVLFAVGDMVKTALEVYEALREEMIRVTVVNMRFVKPFDEELVRELASRHTVVVTMEDNVVTGGFGERVGAFLQRERVEVKGMLTVALPDEFVPHGTREELLAAYGLDAESVIERIRSVYKDVR